MCRGLLHGHGLGGGTCIRTGVCVWFTVALGWCPRLDGHLHLCLCSHLGVVCGHIGGHHGYGVCGCGHNVGGGVAGMGN